MSELATMDPFQRREPGTGKVWNCVVINVPGKPVAWSRTRHKGKRHFNAPAYAAWKISAAWMAKTAMVGHKPFEGPLVAIATICVPIPPSWPKKKRQAALDGDLKPTEKPDWDNLGKAISDACNGIVYIDDSQLVDVRVKKIYALEPGMLFEIWTA